ncbi:MAG: zinc ABC transporter substrate-binding protein [Phycisphaerae bacterium]|nr:zinc ABC transporter substrate-binding protein [Phycisphaerae bacterium]
MKPSIGTVLTVVLALASFGCGDAPSSKPSGKPVVLCTTTMIADLARNLAGDHVLVRGIMKTGEDPHVYEVRPRDAQAIATADLVLINGLHLEATLAHVVEHQARGQVAALAEDPRIKTIGGGKAAAPDPHCWLNVEFFKIYTERARDALVKLDPAHAESYRKNAAAYLTQLTELHTWGREQIATVPRTQRVMVTSHDAFQYFGRAYDIDVFAVIGMSTDQQPTGRDKLRLQQMVEKRGAKALFIETSVSQALNDMVRQIAEATGARIGGTLYSDSLGAPGTEAGTYIGMFRHNVSTIVQALK